MYMHILFYTHLTIFDITAHNLLEYQTSTDDMNDFSTLQINYEDILYHYFE